MAYDTSGVLPGALVGGFDDGTNLLVSGPAMSGKRTVLLELLARGEADGEGSVLLTSSDPGEEIVADYEDVVGDGSRFLRVVDCVSSQSGSVADTDRVRYVSSPGDLTGLGIEFSEVVRDAEGAGVDRLRVGFHSLSPLLMYVDLQRLFRFLHVFTSQIQSRDWLGAFAIDPESHDAQTINTLSQLFDGVLEVQVADDGTREARLRGVQDAPSDWVALA